MSSRDFTDSRGRAWHVWSTVPATTSVLATDFAAGWLTFESAGSLRRLAPIPRDWEMLRDPQLEYLCLCASEMPRRTGPLPRLERPGGESTRDQQRSA